MRRLERSSWSKGPAQGLARRSSEACGPGKVPEGAIAPSNKDEGHQVRYTSKL